MADVSIRIVDQAHPIVGPRPTYAFGLATIVQIGILQRYTDRLLARVGRQIDATAAEAARREATNRRFVRVAVVITVAAVLVDVVGMAIQIAIAHAHG